MELHCSPVEVRLGEKKSNRKFSVMLFGKLDQIHFTFHSYKKLVLEKVRQAGKYNLEQEFLKPALPLRREYMEPHLYCLLLIPF